MNICRVCNLEKDEDEFYWKIKSKNIRQLECKVCTKKMVSNHYLKNKDYYKNKTKYHSNLKREWLKNFKSNIKCEKCGENHIATLDFHHVNPNNKNFEISISIQKNFSIENIKKEIEKCIVLCSNCHRKIHWEQNNGSIV